MRQVTGDGDETNRTTGGSLDSSRRSVLQAIGALGVGAGAVGGASAQQSGDGTDGGDDEGVPVGIQLYTLRNLPDTVLDLISRVGSVDNNGGPGFDVVEFAGLGDASTEEINTALSETGVSAASAHIGLGQLEGDSFQGTVDTYQAVGVDTFIVPYIDPSSIDTVSKVEALAERMNAVAENLPEGIRLGFHNHDGEFQQLGDGRTPLQVFDEVLNDDVIFEIDVGWVLTAGYDPVEVIRQYSDRTELIHMKDMANGNFAEIGEGGVDMSEVARVAREEANVDYLIYEHDQPTNPAGSTGTGAGVLSFLDGEPGLECLDFADVGGPDYQGSLSGVPMGDAVDDSAGTPVGIQLYTLRDLPDSTAEIIRRVGSVNNNGGPGYDAIEFYTLDGSSVSEVQAALDETGLEAASVHTGLGSLEGDNLQSTLDTYSQLGVTNYIVPSLSFPDSPTAQDIQNLAERFNAVAANLPDGSRTGFHNHDAVFQQVEDGRTILEVLDANLDEGVVFEIDVGWVLTAGHDPAEVISKYSERTELTHMKDMENGEFREIGEGAVDWEEVSRVAREEANVDYMFYEHDAPANPAESVSTGAGALSFLDGAPGLECLTIEDIGGPDYDGDLSGGSNTGGGGGPVSIPFGYDAGGGEIDGTVTIDGLEFVDSSPAVTVDAASSTGTNVGATSPDEPISGTENDDLYRTEGWGENLSYQVDVENGTYDVTLYFAEIYFGGQFGGSQVDGGEGSRVFDVTVEGQQVLSELDIFAEVGHDAALTETVEGVEVTDGTLNIGLNSVVHNSKISGFAIRSADDDTGGDGGEYTVPCTGGGTADEPAFTLLPEGDTFTDLDGDSDPSGSDDLSAEFYLGYDSENLYLRAEVTDDVHTAMSGSSMWQADSIQWAVGSDGTYGPEYGLSLADGETSIHQWIAGNAAAGTSAIDASVSRDGTTTTYEATVPWNALFAEAPSAGDSFPFGVLVNERDDGSTRDGVLGWTLPGINVDKTVDALGTLTLSTDECGDGGETGPNGATDPDGDGRYEDLNGDGEATYDDVVTFFEDYDESYVQDNPEAFDFNGNGRLDFDDIVELFRKI